MAIFRLPLRFLMVTLTWSRNMFGGNEQLEVDRDFFTLGELTHLNLTRFSRVPVDYMVERQDTSFLAH